MVHVVVLLFFNLIFGDACHIFCLFVKLLFFSGPPDKDKSGTPENPRHAKRVV